MYYLYILKSQINDSLYVGKTADLKNRFIRHNNGYVKSTKAYKPWTLIYYEAYCSSKDASKRELQLKNHAAKNALKNRLKYSLE